MTEHSLPMMLSFAMLGLVIFEIAHRLAKWAYRAVRRLGGRPVTQCSLGHFTTVPGHQSIRSDREIHSPHGSVYAVGLRWYSEIQEMTQLLADVRRRFKALEETLPKGATIPSLIRVRDLLPGYGRLTTTQKRQVARRSLRMMIEPDKTLCFVTIPEHHRSKFKHILPLGVISALKSLGGHHYIPFRVLRLDEHGREALAEPDGWRLHAQYFLMDLGLYAYMGIAILNGLNAGSADWLNRLLSNLFMLVRVCFVH